MANTKKYRLILEDCKTTNGRKLYRIEALKNFDNIKIGELGGYIESEDNLSHEGGAWVCNNARVFGHARVRENAIVGGDARVHDTAVIHGSARVYDNVIVNGNARIYGNARIRNNAWIYDNARICDNALVCNDARVYGRSWVCGDAMICGYAWIHGNAIIRNNAVIYDQTGWLVVGPVGSRDDFTTFFLDRNGNIYVSCGCFYGSIEEFEKAVEKTHVGTRYEKDYKSAISFAKDRLSIIKN